MPDEYVDNTPVGDGGAPPVVLDIPAQETQPVINAPEVSEDKSAQLPAEKTDAQGEQPVEKTDAEAAAAKENEEAQVDVEAKTPEEKASHWRGEYFKSKQASEARIAELEGQLTEATATPGFLKLDKPPGEWNPEEELRGMPAAYRDKLRAHDFWSTLPNVVNNIDRQSPEVSAALYRTFQQVIEKHAGIPFEQVLQWGAEKEAERTGTTAAPTQRDQPQSNLVQELEAAGYTDADPIMRAAKSDAARADAQEARLKRLEAANKTTAQQQEGFAKQQQDAVRAQAEQAFESQKTTVWNNALKTFEGKVPQGKEFMLDFIRDRAEKLVNSDDIAKGHLEKVRGFLLAATTPEEREEYEKLARGSLVAYNAKVAIAVQQAAKHLLGEAAEKEHLRTLVSEQQQTRRDITPGQSEAPSGSREDILKTKINGNPDVAAEMAYAIHKARLAS